MSDIRITPYRTLKRIISLVGRIHPRQEPSHDVMFRTIKGFLLRSLMRSVRETFNPDSIKEIVIFRYDRVGDMIVSLPFIKSLASKFKGARVTILASESNACIIEAADFCSEVLIKPPKMPAWFFLLLRLRKRKIDLVVDLNHSVATHAIIAARIIKPRHAATPFKEGRWGVKGHELTFFDLMPHQHYLRYERPISQTYLDIANLLGCQIDRKAAYPLPRYTKMQEMAANHVVLNPTGSRLGMQLRDHDVKYITKFIYQKNKKIKVVVPSLASNYARLKQLLGCEPNVLVLNPSATILPILSVVEHCELVITPDTALVHIACAYKKRLIAIYTSDEKQFKQWQPINANHTWILRSQKPKSLDGYSLNTLLTYITEGLRYLRFHT